MRGSGFPCDKLGKQAPRPESRPEGEGESGEGRKPSTRTEKKEGEQGQGCYHLANHGSTEGLH